MDVLPIEIIELVVEHCAHSSLKQLRLVSRLFQKLTTARVFENFYMAPFEENFEKLTLLAKSPLAKHVTYFSLFADILPSWSRMQWERSIDCYCSIDRRPNRPNHYMPRRGFEYLWAYQSIRALNLDGADTSKAVFEESPTGRIRAPDSTSSVLSTIGSSYFTDSELEAGWDEFQRLRREQYEWHHNLHGIVFKEAFAMLPNIIQAEVVTALPYLGTNNDLHVWARAEQNRPSLHSQDWLSKTDYRIDPRRRRVSGQVVLCLLESIGFRSSFAGTNQITKLAVHSVHTETFGDLIKKASNSSRVKSVIQQNTRLHMVQDVFRYLTEIYLHVPHAVDCWTPGSDPSIELATLLSVATSLRRLTLMCKERKGEAFMRPSPCHIFKHLSRVPQLWPQIEQLTLCIDTQPKILLSLLQLLAPSLHSLELRDMLVEDVPYLLQRIPKILNLQHIYVESIWHGKAADVEFPLQVPYLCFLSNGSNAEEPLAQGTKAYLMRKRDHMPDLTHLNDVWAQI